MYITGSQKVARCGVWAVSSGISGTHLMSLFLREHDRLRRVAAGMGMDATDTEDVLQDISIQVLRYEGTFEDETGMMRWLIKITVNRCLTEHRRRFRHCASRILERRHGVPDHIADSHAVDEHVALTEEIDIVRQTLHELDPSMLSAVVLRYFCDLTSSEIAEIMEWNASTVRVRLQRARLILAGKLLRRGMEPL